MNKEAAAAALDRRLHHFETVARVMKNKRKFPVDVTCIASCLRNRMIPPSELGLNDG